MQYSDTSTNQGIIQDITFNCDATLTDYTIEDRTRNVNKWYHKAAVVIQTADGTWQWDDANNTTLPEGTTNIVSGQKNYTLSDSMLEVERVECKDASGNWSVLKPVYYSTVSEALDEYKSTTGTPLEYDKIGRSLVLYPAANYDSTGGLKVYFKRHANIFTTADTTKEPGFAEAFHSYLSLGASLNYCLIYKTERVANLNAQIQQMEENMKLFYGRRSKDETRRMTPAFSSCK